MRKTRHFGWNPPTYHGVDDDTIYNSLEAQIGGVAEIRKQEERNFQEE